MGARSSCSNCDSSNLLGQFEDCGASPSIGPSAKADGEHVAEMADGSNYEGQFKGWQRHGSGKLTWACGDKFEGQFCQNNMHGHGVMRWINGVSYRGQWQQSELGPTGTMKWPDGREYAGHFANGEKHGQGRLVWPGGRCYDGQWANGRQDGFGFISVLPGPAHLCQWDAGKLKRWLADTDLAALPCDQQAKAALACGSVRLLRSTWLLEQPDDYTLKRHQDLPSDAFVAPAEAVELLDRRYGIIVVSYLWLTKLHPDPNGFHLGTFRKYLQKHIEYFTGFSDPGIFWDFASMHQKGPAGEARSEEEQRIWRVGLRALGTLYGGKKTLVVKLTRMPEGCHLTPYDHRGWCFIEATLCGILKETDLLLDLGLLAVGADDLDWDQLRDSSIGSRHPPVLPEDMRAALEKKTFGDGEDMEPIFDVYNGFFMEAAPTVMVLGLANARIDAGGWGDTEMKLFCRALPQFTSCKALSLANHQNISKAGLKSLHQQLPALRSLQRLIVPEHLQSSKEGQALAKEWSAAGKNAEQLVWMKKFEEVKVQNSPSLMW